MKWKTEQLDLLAQLGKNEKEMVMQEYNRGWHFLLVFSKLSLFVVIGGYLYLQSTYFPDSTVVERAIVSLLFWGIANVFYVNFIAKKVIKDLIKDMNKTI